MDLLIVVLVFGGMVFLHEFGHFLASRLFKIEVEEFGFGFPPKILTLFRWKGTDFTLNALPIGGFVRPKGENDPNIPDGLAAANPWKRLGVLVAGPLMNLLTAILITSLLIAQTGIDVQGRVLIKNVSAASPAQQAGIQPDDVLLAVNGTPVTQLDQARTLIHNGIDTPLEFTLERGGQQVKIQATPLSSRSPDQGALGVGLGYPRRQATIGEVVSGGFVYTGAQALSILYIPIGLMQGVVQPGEARLIGLKGIYDIFSQAIQRDVESRQPVTAEPTTSGQAPRTTTEPSNYILTLVAMLSVSLAVFNLLPIPALDGGRILFTLPEIIFRRRIPYKLENVINGVAMLLLIALMVFINAMDFIHPANILLP
ncbi:MAG TPA: M50 family metallopeptidase [Anaerolineales bacterium]